MNIGTRRHLHAIERARPGFTMTEMMVVVVVVAILAMVAVPSIQDRLVREQMVEAVQLADIA